MLSKLLCYFGFHNHLEIVDEQATKEWNDWAKAMDFPISSPCTYLQCSRCGHTYGYRTVSFSSKFIKGE